MSIWTRVLDLVGIKATETATKRATIAATEAIAKEAAEKAAKETGQGTAKLVAERVAKETAESLAKRQAELAALEAANKAAGKTLVKGGALGAAGYAYAQHKGDEQAEQQANAPGLAQSVTDMINPPDGSQPTIGMGSLVGMGALAALGVALGGGPLVAIGLAVLGGFIGQPVLNAVSKTTDQPSQNTPTVPAAPVETPKQNAGTSAPLEVVAPTTPPMPKPAQGKTAPAASPAP